MSENKVKRPRWRIIKDNIPGAWQPSNHRPDLGSDSRTILIPSDVIPVGAVLEFQSARKVRKHV